MNWICPKCNETLGELNAYCEYCRYADGSYVYNPDKTYIRDIRIYHLSNGAKPMTPQEEKFADLFKEEMSHPSVKELFERGDILGLRARREELADIALKAKASMYADDQLIKELEKKKKGDRPTGFSRSVNVDETTSDAINAVKERRKKMSKNEKLLEQMKGLGIENAEGLFAAGTILAKLKEKAEPKESDKKAEEIIKGNIIQSPLGQENGFTLVTPKVESKQETLSEHLTFKNPFAKKD